MSSAQSEEQVEPLSQAEQIAVHYNKWWFADVGNKARCNAILRTLVRERTIQRDSAEGRAIDADMRREHCLDEYSHLYGGELYGTGTAAKKLDNPSVETIGTYLFVYINTFVGSGRGEEIIQLVKQRISAMPVIETVVVDVRGNPGGHIDELHVVLNGLFAPASGIKYLQPLGQMTFKKNSKFFTTDQRGMLSGHKIRILTDRATASASEWMIETLCYEWYPDSCATIGSTTLGKSILQCHGEPAGIEVRLTCGEWFLPDRPNAKDQAKHPHRVQGIGITPDRPMSFDCDRYAYACIAQKLADAGM